MKKQILLVFMCIAFIGCSPIYYVPNSQNVPMMKEKGQTNLFMSVGESADANTFEFQAAYALTDMIALQVNSFLATSLNSDEDSFKGFGNVMEFGAGYYKEISPTFVFETYGLFGFGNVDNKLLADSYMAGGGNVKAEFFRVGLQPSLSYSPKHFSAGISSRIANLDYHHINGNLISDVDYLKANNSHWLFEPAITIQAGLENFKFQLQYVYSINLTDPNFTQDLDHISLGLKFNIKPTKKIKQY